jgi:hypothetical protein
MGDGDGRFVGDIFVWIFRYLPAYIVAKKEEDSYFVWSGKYGAGALFAGGGIHGGKTGDGARGGDGVWGEQIHGT